MEFRFRAVDKRPAAPPPPPLPPHPHPPSFFPPQSTHFNHRGVYPITNEFRRGEFFNRNPIISSREAAEWEMEKISMRRMLLEMEVRNEMMMEREFALRRMLVENGTFSPSASLSFYNHSESFEDRIGRLVEEKHFGFRPVGGGQMGHFGLNIGGSRTAEIKALPEVDTDKDKVIVMAKPDPSTSGAKRKALSPPTSAVSELLKKKPREEWSCALCQVSATSERGLNEHLEGRRHKAKEAGLVAQKMGKTKPLPKNKGKPTKFGETMNIPCSDQGLKIEGKSLQANESNEASEQKTQNGEDTEKILEATKDAEAENLKEKGEVMVQKKTKKMRKLKFWCEMCQKGAFNEKVMTMHKKGKQHLLKLEELGKNNGVTNTAPAILPLPEGSQQTNNLEEVAEEENKIKKENVDRIVDCSDSSAEAIKEVETQKACINGL